MTTLPAANRFTGLDLVFGTAVYKAQSGKHDMIKVMREKYQHRDTPSPAVEEERNLVRNLGARELPQTAVVCSWLSKKEKRYLETRPLGAL